MWCEWRSGDICYWPVLLEAHLRPREDRRSPPDRSSTEVPLQRNLVSTQTVSFIAYTTLSSLPWFARWEEVGEEGGGEGGFLLLSTSGEVFFTCSLYIVPMYHGVCNRAWAVVPWVGNLDLKGLHLTFSRLSKAFRGKRTPQTAVWNELNRLENKGLIPPYGYSWFTLVYMKAQSPICVRRRTKTFILPEKWDS